MNPAILASLPPVPTESMKELATGMTKNEAVAMVVMTLFGIACMIVILSYVIRLHLKPLQEVPKQLTDLNARVKSGEDLNRMIDVKVQEHALNCPGRSACVNQNQGSKAK